MSQCQLRSTKKYGDCSLVSGKSFRHEHKESILLEGWRDSALMNLQAAHKQKSSSGGGFKSSFVRAETLCL